MRSSIRHRFCPPSRGWRRACHRALAALMLAAAGGLAVAQWQPSSPEQQALDQAAFSGIQQSLASELSDIQSLVVASDGRVRFEFYRDGQPDALRDVQSVAKSAVSTLIGIAVGQGQIASLDKPVVALIPEWAAANTDERARQITLRHLLTMTAGFDLQANAERAGAVQVQRLWARPLAHEPGTTFGYDNAVVPLLVALLERATGQSLADYSRTHLLTPLGMHEPAYERFTVRMRTLDMATLGQLYLQQGRWNGIEVVPGDYVQAATTAQNSGGAPRRLPYGYLWWVLPTQSARPTFTAVGYGGQFIWVQPASNTVVAGTSTVSTASASRDQLWKLIGTQVRRTVRQRQNASTNQR